MHRIRLKVALVEAGKTHWRAASEANELLPAELHLSEHDITRLVTRRKTPHPQQAAALAEVLHANPSDLFPTIGKGGAA